MRTQERSQLIEKLLNIGIDGQVRSVHVALQIAVSAVVVAVVDKIHNHVATAQLALDIAAGCSWARTYEVPLLRCQVESLLGRRHQCCLVRRHGYWRRAIDDRSRHIW